MALYCHNYIGDATTYKGVHATRMHQLLYSTYGDAKVEQFWVVWKDYAEKSAGTYGEQAFHDMLYEQLRTAHKLFTHDVHEYRKLPDSQRSLQKLFEMVTSAIELRQSDRVN